MTNPRRIVLLLVLAGLTCPLYVARLDTSIDATWTFALNHAASHGLIHGRDVYWTWGPLGYLAAPLDMGSNLVRARVVQIAAWVAVMGALTWLSWRGHTRDGNLLSLAICLSPLVFSAGRLLLDYYLLFLLFLLLTIGSITGRWIPAVLAAILLAAALCLMKLTAGLMAIAAIACWVVIFRRRRAWVLAAFLTPLTFVGAYFLHNPSIVGLLGYTWGALEIASGYATAMTIRGSAAELYAGLALLVLWIAAVTSLRTQLAFPLSWMLAPALAVSFRHGFIRQDDHVLYFFHFFAAAVGILLLTVDFSRYKGKLPISLATMAAFLWIGATGNWPRHSGFHLTVQPPELAVAASRLSSSMRSRVGGEPVSFLSPLHAHASLDGVNYVPFPILQLYSAYTAPLDRKVAEWLAVNGPRWIVADWQAVDGRHPLADTPETWLALFRHYEFDSRDSDRVLLRRRDIERFQGFATGNSLLKLSIRPNLLGAAARALWRVPEAYLELRTESGRVRIFRTPPEVLQTRLLSARLPDNPDQLTQVMRGDAWGEQVEAVRLIGPGSRYYDEVRIVERLGLVGLADANPLAPIPQLLPPAAEGRIETRVDQVLTVDGALIVRGWAVDKEASAPAAAVFLTIGGRDFPASSGMDRPDVAAHFGAPGLRFTGFQAILSWSDLPAGSSKAVLRVITHDSAAVFTATPVIPFKAFVEQ